MPRRTGLKQAFLAAYPEVGTVRGTCHKVGIVRTTFHKWMKADPKFVEDFQAAKEDAADRLEEEVMSRVEERVKGSNVLLMFLLNGLRPEKYRQRRDIRHEGAVPGVGAPMRVVVESVEAPKDQEG